MRKLKKQAFKYWARTTFKWYWVGWCEWVTQVP